jgi:hypothetical protein
LSCLSHKLIVSPSPRATETSSTTADPRGPLPLPEQPHCRWVLRHPRCPALPSASPRSPPRRPVHRVTLEIPPDLLSTTATHAPAMSVPPRGEGAWWPRRCRHQAHGPPRLHGLISGRGPSRGSKSCAAFGPFARRGFPILFFFFWNS